MKWMIFGYWLKSHAFDEIKTVINHPLMLKNFKNFDLGCLQYLTGYYPNYDKSELMTWEGCDWMVSKLYKTGLRYKTKKPWCYHPGYYAEWKCDKVEDYKNRLIRLSKK